MSNTGTGPHFGSGLTIETAANVYDHKARLTVFIALRVALGTDLIVFVAVVVGRRWLLKRQPGHSSAPCA